MYENAPGDLDLDAYCHRIGYAGRRQATLAVLEEIHLAHATTIPFENLDIQLGRPIAIDLTSVQAKLVYSRRGGYCFEQNTLLAAVLERLGFTVTCLSARVRFGATRVLPRTHMMLKVDVEEGSWLADVGFGTGGLLKPIRLVPGELSRQFGFHFRLAEDGGFWVLESLREATWQALYVFTLEPHYPIDFEMANHYVSTHPNSRFVQTLAVQRQTPDACYLLRNRDLTVIKDGKNEAIESLDDQALLSVLAETFGLVFPAGTKFRCLSNE